MWTYVSALNEFAKVTSRQTPACLPGKPVELALDHCVFTRLHFELVVYFGYTLLKLVHSFSKRTTGRMLRFIPGESRQEPISGDTINCELMGGLRGW